MPHIHCGAFFCTYFYCMNKFFLAACFIVALLSCGEKKKSTKEGDGFFPVKSYIQSQISHVDTSVYTIIKIVTANGKSDTTYIKREEFKTYAKDFLTTPDISPEDYKETNLFDELLERAIINYTTEDEDAEVRRVEVIVQPNPEGDKVQSIFIDQLINNKKNALTKRMFWEVDKRFRITTITNSKNSEQVETIDVVWNDFPSAK